MKGATRPDKSLYLAGLSSLAKNIVFAKELICEGGGTSALDLMKRSMLHHLTEICQLHVYDAKLHINTATNLENSQVGNSLPGYRLRALLTKSTAYASEVSAQVDSVTNC